MTDTTNVKPGEKDLLRCEECDSTEHTTNGHFEGGSVPTGHFEGGSAPASVEK
jgi:hypothetical protein